MKKNMEKGSIMVEAAIIYPFVLITIMAMLVLCLIKMQETIVVFATQRSANNLAKEMSYPNFSKLGDEQKGANVGMRDFPDSEKVNFYYDKKELYSQLTQDYGEVVAKEKTELEAFLLNYTFLRSSAYDVNIEAKKGLFPSATVATEYFINMPKFVRYIGLREQIVIKAKAMAYVSKPSEFIRNVDIAVDLSSFLLKKFGLEEGLNTFLAKLNDLGSALK